MKNKIKLIIIGVLVLIITIFVGTIVIGFNPVSDKSEEITFIVKKGKGKIDVINDLYEANLIKSKLSGYVHVLTNNVNLQAGTYKLNRNMNLKAIIKYINDGKIDSIVKTYKITFIEGKTLKKYVEQIVKKTNENYDDVIKSLSDKEYLQSLIKKYDFIDESILNSKLYYPLEGYLFPSTYEVYENSKAKDIITKMLDKMANVLDEYKLNPTDYTYHEILTMASIIELEGTNKENRASISQVIYSRLNKKMALGMDVTSYYGVQKELSEVILKKDLIANNAYNTRNNSFIGLPVGPIACPSMESINAVYLPSETDYLYFYADVKTGNVYFAKDYSGHQALIRQYGG